MKMKNLNKFLVIILLIISFGCSCKKEEIKYVNASVYSTYINDANYNEPRYFHYYVVKLSEGKYAFTSHSYYHEKDVETDLSNYPWYTVSKLRDDWLEQVKLTDTVRIKLSDIKIRD